MFKTIDRYEETGIGLPYPIILVDSAEEEIDDATGERVGVSIPDMENLVISVALARVFIPTQLTGAEVRFIRQVLDMSATAFASDLTLDKATFSRWENGHQTVGEWADKQVRQIAVIKLAPRVPCLSIDPQDIVKLRTVSGPAPHIEMKRIHVQEDRAGDCGEAWDMALSLAA